MVRYGNIIIFLILDLFPILGDGGDNFVGSHRKSAPRGTQQSVSFIICGRRHPVSGNVLEIRMTDMVQKPNNFRLAIYTN
jgi:hypothetical protein